MNMIMPYNFTDSDSDIGAKSREVVDAIISVLQERNTPYKDLDSIFSDVKNEITGRLVITRDMLPLTCDRIISREILHRRGLLPRKRSNNRLNDDTVPDTLNDA